MIRETVQFSGFEFDATARELRRDGTVLPLRPKVNRLLLLLVERAGKTTDRDSIRRSLWGDQTVVEFDMGISACVRELRQALDQLHPGASRLVTTVPTEGYRLDVEIDVSPPDTPKRSHGLAIAALLAGVMAAGVWLAIEWWDQSAGRRIVILPIRDLSVDAIEPRYLDSVFEDVLQRLGPLDPAQLGVVPGISVRRLDTDSLSAREIGGQLDAQLVLESTARIVDNHLLLTLSLLDAGEEVMLWGEILEFDVQRPPTNRVADRIADLVADAAGVQPAPLTVEPTALDSQSRLGEDE